MLKQKITYTTPLTLTTLELPLYVHGNECPRDKVVIFGESGRQRWGASIVAADQHNMGHEYSNPGRCGDAIRMHKMQKAVRFERFLLPGERREMAGMNFAG